MVLLVSESQNKLFHEYFIKHMTKLFIDVEMVLA